MLMLISDVHGQFEVVNKQIEHAEKVLKKTVSEVIILGDVGIFEPGLADFFIKEGQRFPRPVSFIEGNHEDFNQFGSLVARYSEYLTHLPKASIQKKLGYSFLCLGGSAYMDSLNTPMLSEIRSHEIERCLGFDRTSVDILLTHDCPTGIGVPNTEGLEHYGPPGFPGSDKLLAHFSPRLWIFGHHHKWFQKEIGSSRFFGLSLSWEGYGLLGDDFRFEIVLNRVEQGKTSWLTRLWRFILPSST